MAQNYDLINTGPEVQRRLDQVPVTAEELAVEQQQRKAVDASLQAQIDGLKSGMASLTLTATPSVVHVGKKTTVKLEADSSVAAESIVIRRGATPVAHATGAATASATDDVAPTEEGRTEYTADFTIAGLVRTAETRVQAVHPVVYGAGVMPADATGVATPRTTPAGTYTVTVGTPGDRIFFLVPATMAAIQKATMNGFGFPLDTPEDVTLGDVAYKAYGSQNTYDAGTYTIILT